ncbi:MAG TPA: hypothetical protein VGX25_06090 [Actinophytocola sp.]|uniref:hypothetical protein n=1 Tax=Actinophytocola sp. TaxID=1872138 RepID=UPI002DDD44B9|nr:hypothetical protein [Actinophytocola sp.]HEV2778956.1 hypothetical protein [Actinophytocola sp.]
MLDDEDEFTAAVEAVVATFAPHAKVDGRTKRRRAGGRCCEVPAHCARTGSRSLSGFIGVLAALPDGMSRLGTLPPSPRILPSRADRGHGARPRRPSHFPAGPLRLEEVIDRAGGRPAGVIIAARRRRYLS